MAYTKPVLRPLTAEEAEALAAYAREHGRFWKSKLLGEWLRASTAPALQSLRNSHGPSWLCEYRLPAGGERRAAALTMPTMRRAIR